MIKQISQKVSIECKFLDDNIENHILQNLRNRMTGQWTLDNGYIIDVIRIVQLGDNTINPATTLVVFDVTYEIETLKPKKNLELSGNVCMVFHQGLFVDIRGLMNVLIPAKTMDAFYFDQGQFCSKDKNISKDDKVQIRLTNVQYTDQKYICIGVLI